MIRNCQVSIFHMTLGKIKHPIINFSHMKKEEIIKIILEEIKRIGLPVTTKVNTAKWKADIVVDYGKYKVAFNIGKNPRNIKETYLAMHEERVCGCWLLLPSKNGFSPTIGDEPCFSLFDKNGKLEVLLNKVWEEEITIELSDFISSLIKGNIRHADKIKIKYVDVCFYKKECWKCHRESDVYFVYKSISEDDIEIEGGIENFNPNLIKGIKQYIKDHPEKGIALGEIKPRLSRTIQETYPSFGCAYCDSLFGKFFIQDSFAEMIYYANKLPKARIEITDDIVVNVGLWYKRK